MVLTRPTSRLPGMSFHPPARPRVGTDAAPYFRIFNPVTQSEKFDAGGTYIRRWVPELADVEGKAIHRTWTLPGGPPNGYPDPIVDHAAERQEALGRYNALPRK